MSAPEKTRANAECARCHADHASSFATSAHARATESELFRALRDRADANTRAFCDRCHAPHETVGERGVGCVTCHTAIATRGVSNGRLVMGDGDEMLGGFDAVATAAHRSVRSAFTRSSDLCGTCHEVAGPGAFTETPYSEWLRAPSRVANVTCADCHMASSPGTSDAAPPMAPAASDGPLRARSDHAFVGPEHPRANELLRRSAAIDLSLRDRSADALHVDVTVTNRNPGHSLPSGARFAREVWIEVVAIDASGARHTVTGGLDDRGAPLAEPSRIELADRVTHMGVAALPLAADRVEVRALAAGERRTWSLSVAPSWGASPTVTITARLRYRRNDFALREALGLAPDTVAPFDLASAALSL